VQVTLPEELARLLDPNGKRLDERVRQALVLLLIQEDEISSRKGAELLGISWDEMLDLMSKHDIPYFRQSVEDLRAEIGAAEEALLQNKSR